MDPQGLNLVMNTRRNVCALVEQARINEDENLWGKEFLRLGEQ